MTNLHSILLTFLCYILLSCNSNAQTATIPVVDFQKAIGQADIQLLDVRTAEEYQSGHLENALQADWTNTPQFEERVKSLDKTKPVYIYCLSGGRSSAAMDWLFKNGFAQIYNMKGGITAWKQANMPVEGVNEVAQISMKNFLASIPKDKTVLVDFGAPWCPPCKKMNPILDELSKENHTIIKVNGAEQTELCKEMKIDGFPVLIVYKNGIEISRQKGAFSKEEILTMLK
jgi:rhodanese-related sulfurtransferase/glutaredoxin